MTNGLRRAAESARVRLRGVTARLVATFLIIASAVAALGVVVFSLLLSRTLQASVDSDLQTRASTYVADVRGGDIEQMSPGAAIDAQHAQRRPAAVAAVYRPDGSLVEAEPTLLAADPKPADSRDGLHTVHYDGRPFRFLREQVATRQGVWVVMVGQSLAAMKDANSDARHQLYVIVPIALILSGVGAWLLSRAALRPVDRMRADAQRLSETATAGSIGVPATTDSLNKLAVTFNTLLHRLQTSMQRQRDLVADAGHELRTPLAVLQTELQTAVRPGRTRDDLIDSILHAQAETARLAALSEDLLLLAQADGPARIVQPETTDLIAVVGECANAHREDYLAGAVTLVTPEPGTAEVLADVDPVALRRMLDNLFANALRYTPRGGTVSVRVIDRTDEAVVSVDDTGPGFPIDFLPHAFERFARADRSRSRSSAASGSGLGLSIVATLAEAHRGSATAENLPGGGARIALHFPYPSNA